MGSILIVAEIQNGQIREASYELASFAQQVAAEVGRHHDLLDPGDRQVRRVVGAEQLHAGVGLGIDPLDGQRRED